MVVLDSRRTFLKTTFLGGAVLVMSGTTLYGAVSPLQTMVLAQKDLFPYIDNFEVNGAKYLTLILNHSRVDEEEKKFLRNGVQWLNEEALSMFNDMYINLASDKRQDVLQYISKYRWGESWIDSMLTYTMEALFSDKAYGVNMYAKASEWIEFKAGLPHPKEPYL